MKRKITVIIILLWCFSLSGQTKFKGVSTFFPGIDSVEVSKADISYLLKHAQLICSKVDTLDDGAMMKTVEIACQDTTFKFIGAYMESNLVQRNELMSYAMEGKKIKLQCFYVVIDQGELYEEYQLDSLGRKQFEAMLNKAPLRCIDSYK